MGRIRSRVHMPYGAVYAAGLWTQVVVSLFLAVWVSQLATGTPEASNFWFSLRAGAALGCIAALTYFALLIACSFVPLRNFLPVSTTLTAAAALLLGTGLAQIWAVSSVQVVSALQKKADEQHSQVFSAFDDAIKQKEKELVSVNGKLSQVDNELKTASAERRQELQNTKEELTAAKTELEQQSQKFKDLQNQVEANKDAFDKKVAQLDKSQPSADGTNAEGGTSTGKDGQGGGTGDKDDSNGSNSGNTDNGIGGSDGSSDGSNAGGSGGDSGEGQTNDGNAAGKFIAAAAAILSLAFPLLKAFLPGLLAAISLGTDIRDLPAAYQAAEAIVRQGDKATVESVLGPVLDNALKNPQTALNTVRDFAEGPLRHLLPPTIVEAIGEQVPLFQQLLASENGLPLKTARQLSALLEGLGDLGQLSPETVAARLPTLVVPGADRGQVFDTVERLLKLAGDGKLNFKFEGGLLKPGSPVDATKVPSLLEAVKKVRDAASQTKTEV